VRRVITTHRNRTWHRPEAGDVVLGGQLAFYMMKQNARKKDEGEALDHHFNRKNTQEEDDVREKTGSWILSWNFLEGFS